MNPSPRSAPVVIVGAGPTGVTAATLLAQYGISCLLLDRWETVYPQPRAVHLDDEIRRIMGRLGIGDEFAAITRAALGLRLVDKELRTLAQFDRDPARSIHGFPQANMFDQPELEGILRANLKEHNCVRFQGNAEVTHVSQHEPAPVRVEFTDRISGEEHVVDASYVLGCDGANSVVRASIGAVMGNLRFAQRWLVVDVTTDAAIDLWDGVYQVCNPDRAATYMRVGDNRYRWEFRLREGETVDDFASPQTLYRLISAWVTDISPDRLSLVRVAEYTFGAGVASSWRQGNVFLLGDAAHLTPPFIGQGMSAGIRDAANLTWKLAGVLSEILPPSVLDTYQRERKPHARAMIGLALTMGWSMTAGGRTGNAVRRALIPRLHHIPGARQLITSSRTPALRSSALVHKTFRGRRLAGRLCPNPELSDGTRLDTVLGNGFALITTESPTAAQLGQLRHRGAVIVDAPPGSELARWLRRGGVTTAVIRPDRTVMQAGRQLDDLCDSVPRFMLCSNGVSERKESQ
ncbi:bifunctional 3-(3-hydroxy-phenyl)propionate/3-hydroxycinnamic acid hydroxylase [Mycobacterium riyadhense]|uniref:3-(3-hydroxyphenyl)propionate hydroxylase n=1 Tax=Mycobacterium riyadhense TaxID=486698 RepID=A0A1X2D9Z6_9MYCO|nr:bifunctional 3-(3-hydroxy-phenyl)propionate/3-hydroxycinnamic acid hydroxylase [Mycobacterium riyadhense]MCV7149522.1 bifunctional 3-(3-hydroxy-phenyl)propionate/3-hydroxycinnamic acid hydroxylase [Mycobacterium riyadhense]ORW84995.1 3-(3-hydroxyphenyl)propionate hydroxylase [Mycobacterium riyadhense]